jgi:sugar phosphate isomerase/epimerase
MPAGTGRVDDGPHVGASYDLRLDETVEEFAAFLTDLGLSHVEIRAESLLTHPEAPTPRALRELAERYDLSYTFHVPFRDLNPGSFNDDARAHAVEQVKATLNDAAVAGAGGVVYHAGSVPRRYPERVRETARGNAVQSLREVVAHADAVGVPLCVENQPRKPGTVRHTTGVDELASLLADADVDSEYLGVTLDVGHAKVNGTDLEAFLDRFGDRITVVHLHDNDGNGDDHDPMPAFDATADRIDAPYNVLEMKSLADVERSAGVETARE